MKTLVKALFVILPLFLVQIAQAQDVDLDNIIQKTMDGFNQRSGTAYVAHFADDVDYISPTGPHMKGKKKIEETYNMLFSKNLIPKNNAWKVTNHTIRPLADDIVLIHFNGAIKEDNVYGNGSAVALLNDGQWKLASFQLTFIQNQGEQGDR
jgi:uncharacterized protein (TIGR02246 family)